MSCYSGSLHCPGAVVVHVTIHQLLLSAALSEVKDIFFRDVRVDRLIELWLVQIVGLLMLVIGVWVMSIKRSYQAINDALMTPATMILIVSSMLLLTAAIGVVGGTKNKLLLLRLVSNHCCSICLCPVIIYSPRVMWDRRKFLSNPFLFLAYCIFFCDRADRPLL